MAEDLQRSHIVSEAFKAALELFRNKPKVSLVDVAKAAAASSDVAKAVAAVFDVAKASAATQDVAKAAAATVSDVAKASAVGVVDVAKASAAVQEIENRFGSSDEISRARNAVADVAKASAATQDVAKAAAASSQDVAKAVAASGVDVAKAVAAIQDVAKSPGEGMLVSGAGFTLAESLANALRVLANSLGEIPASDRKEILDAVSRTLLEVAKARND